MSQRTASGPKTGSRTAQPVIAAGSLTLRAWRSADADQLVRAFRDPRIRAWHAQQVTSASEARKWMAQWHKRWAARTAAAWAICPTSDPDTVLGQVALRALYLEDGMAECSYWVVPDHRGAGIASKATRALASWAFEELRLHRLEIAHSVRNIQSCRVALKAGFASEGIKRSLQRYADGVHDMHLHACVRKAEKRARPFDRARLDLLSHGTLVTTTMAFSAAMALLTLVYRFAAVVPLVAGLGVLLFRMTNRPDRDRPSGSRHHGDGVADDRRRHNSRPRRPRFPAGDVQLR